MNQQENAKEKSLLTKIIMAENMSSILEEINAELFNKWYQSGGCLGVNMPSYYYDMYQLLDELEEKVGVIIRETKKLSESVLIHSIQDIKYDAQSWNMVKRPTQMAYEQFDTIDGLIVVVHDFLKEKIKLFSKNEARIKDYQKQLIDANKTIEPYYKLFNPEYDSNIEVEFDNELNKSKNLAI